MNRAVGVVAGLLMTAGLALGLATSSEATRYTSPNYTIDASVDSSFGGDNTSGNYQLVSSGGESVVGNGAGGSYLIDQGYVAQLASSLQITIDPSAVNFPTDIAPGVSQSAEVEAHILTDAPGYQLAINQTGDLTSGSNTIPGISGGTIASPLTWSEGATKGLGVSLASTNATPLPAKWASGSAYAALPTTASTIYSRSGFSGGALDKLKFRYRLDVDSSQPTGAYATTAVYTGTMLP